METLVCGEIHVNAVIHTEIQITVIQSSSIPSEFQEESGSIKLTVVFGHVFEAKLACVPVKLGLHIGADTIELLCALMDELTGEVNCCYSGDDFQLLQDDSGWRA